MHPLVSGPEAKRYIEPDTETYILFPYQRTGEAVRLIGAAQMDQAHPQAWAYLQSHEVDLRAREDNSFDDDQWYRFGRTQSLDKQDVVKLIVPRLVANLKTVVDSEGVYYLDNVDVGGICPAEGINPYYLSAVLNSPIARFVFRRISKPFRGDYLSANRQFIAPLPIPRAGEAARNEIGALARELQRQHTARRDTLRDLLHRLDASPSQNRRIDFIFPTLRTARERRNDAPRNVDIRAWTAEAYKQELVERYDAIGSALHAEVALEAHFERGELRLLADGARVIDGIFLADNDGPFISAQWNARLDSFTPPAKSPAKALVTALRRLIVTDNQALRNQVVALEQQQRGQKQDIADREAAINERLYALYGLTEAERRMVEQG